MIVRQPNPDVKAGENLHAKFIFGSCDRMIEATIGRQVDRGEAAGAALLWSTALTEVGVPQQLAERQEGLLADLT